MTVGASGSGKKETSTKKPASITRSKLIEANRR
jgi:hypothetical protein